MLDGDMAYLRKIPNFVSGNVLILCSDFLALDRFITTRHFYELKIPYRPVFACRERLWLLLSVNM